MFIFQWFELKLQFEIVIVLKLNCLILNVEMLNDLVRSPKLSSTWLG